METKKSSFINMVLTLGLVTLIASFALGYVYDWTKEPIAKAKLEKQIRAIRAVVKPYDNDILAEGYRVALIGSTKKKTDSLSFYPAKTKKGLHSLAIKTFSDKGYSGRIELMVGFLPNGTIHNINILYHKETPGLGSKISDVNFLNQYFENTPDEFDLKVSKDGGQVDAISGATISSRAVSEAIQIAFDNYKQSKK